MAALGAGDLRRAVEIFAPTIFSEPGTEELRKQFIDQCMNLPEATITRFFTFDPKNDVADLLGRVAVPTLLAHGGDDRDVPIAAAREMARRIPDRRSTASKKRSPADLYRNGGVLRRAAPLRAGRGVRKAVAPPYHSSLNAVRKVSLMGCRRYSSIVRSPVTIMVSAGMPGWSWRPPSLPSSPAST